jgi:NAD(P)-dependent dehydrogenase (short-subunit alcohol dehydrogenase family)
VDVADLFSVDGKVALVTGGSRGIGEMIVRGLVAAGCTTYLSSRSADACSALAEELGEACIALPADLATPEGCDRLAASLREREAALHLLVNNAGATWGAPLGTYPADGFDKVMATNVRGPFLLTQALLPALEAAATHQDPARVVMIGSIDGLAVPSFESYAYSASKAAIHMMTRHLGRAVAGRDITVNAIAPGLFPSKMTRFLFDDHEEEVVARIPRRRAGDAADIVGTVLYLASRAGAYTTGAVLPVDGGYATLR